MTEQELIQENDKLNARLKKAIQVFSEQKTTIERLTAERDDARKDKASLEELIKELETKQAETDENDAKFFDQLAEIDELKDNMERINGELESTKELAEKYKNRGMQLSQELQESKAEIEAAKAEIDTIKASNEDLQNALDTCQASLNETVKGAQEYRDNVQEALKSALAIKLETV
jgi:chromosome segregation ATPase